MPSLLSLFLSSHLSLPASSLSLSLLFIHSPSHLSLFQHPPLINRVYLLVFSCPFPFIPSFFPHLRSFVIIVVPITIPAISLFHSLLPLSPHHFPLFLPAVPPTLISSLYLYSSHPHLPPSVHTLLFYRHSFPFDGCTAYSSTYLLTHFACLSPCLPTFLFLPTYYLLTCLCLPIICSPVSAHLLSAHLSLLTYYLLSLHDCRVASLAIVPYLSNLSDCIPAYPLNLHIFLLACLLNDCVPA